MATSLPSQNKPPQHPQSVEIDYINHNQYIQGLHNTVTDGCAPLCILLQSQSPDASNRHLTGFSGASWERKQFHILYFFPLNGGAPQLTKLVQFTSLTRVYGDGICNEVGHMTLTPAAQQTRYSRPPHSFKDCIKTQNKTKHTRKAFMAMSMSNGQINFPMGC